ncbi:cyclodeaminase/cyclohydrolase family protein [Arthrobacter sp. CAN_A6]|uniref:cyclodeaminase/cyclohydrolase family protein n=1 Tax=Arthrobacter sp. CAN_A6 TaxID=2787721 RepID=UPI0018C8E50A
MNTQDSTLGQWTEALAKSTGSPGGGAGAGVMLALAASLMSMVAGYTESDAGQQDEIDALIARTQSLRESALKLADEDSAASSAFGAAFRLDPGERRDEAIRAASIEAAKTSAALGEKAIGAIEELFWLAHQGNSALIADVVVACGALRGAISGARTNVSFDLASLTSAGQSLEQVAKANPALWGSVERFNAAIRHIDTLTAEVDDRAAPTDKG